MSPVEVVIDCADWSQALPGAETLATQLYDAAQRREPGLRGEAAILLTDDASLRALNARFRNIDRATNVLAFPSAAADAGFLGDIALAFETCRREADEKAAPFVDHAAHLMLHGMLHLAGHDHMNDEDAEAMESLESDVLRELRLSDPHAAPATGRGR